jgi:methylamine utilization protein MauJ/SEC-C motif-containing protein
MEFKREISRNQPCHCGSGLKYKRCCLGKQTSPSPTKSQPRKESVTLTFPATLPGTRFNFVLCCRWKDPNDPRNHASPAGAPGLYRVSVFFGRSGGTLAGDLQPGGGGDSFIKIPPTGATPNLDVPCAVVEYGVGDEVIHFDGYVNSEGHLARMVAAKVQAFSIAEAELKSLRAINGLLSQFAVRFNVPLHIAKTKIMELATGNHRLALVMPYNDVRFGSELNVAPSQDFKFYASLYREGLNSNSPIYQFLCFYKIIEGLRARRNRIAAELKGKGRRCPENSRSRSVGAAGA